MLVVNGIYKVYHNQRNDVEALKDLNLTIDTNGITMILGASGCGKTTLLNILAGIEQDYEGSVELNGNIAYIEQEIKLLESMSIYDNLYLVNTDIQRLEKLLKQFQLWDERTKKIKKLSTGQKKRVQVLRALLSEADILLCDEPTAALDHENALLVMEALKEIAKSIPVLMVTHEIAIAKTYANRICRMEQGKIIEDNKEQPFVDDICKSHNEVKKPSSMFYLKQALVSRKGETFFHAIFACVFVFAIYTSGTFFLSTNQASGEKNSWNIGENLLIAQPNDGNDIVRKGDEWWENPYETSYYYYDLYTPENVDKIMKEVPEIAGYKAGWDYGKYNIGPTFINFLSLDELKQSIQQYEKQGYGEEPFVEHMREDVRNPQNLLSFRDRFNIRGIHGGDDIVLEITGSSDTIFIQNHDYEMAANADVKPYQLKKSYEIPLVYGKLMQSQEEIIIPYKLAEKFARSIFSKADEESIQKLLGLKFSADHRTSYQDPSILSNGENFRYYTVVGITNMDNANEDRIYMQEGVYDEFRNTVCDMNEEELVYQYISFLVDPSADIKAVSDKVNELLPAVESSFVPFSEIKNEQQTTEAYKNPIIFASIGVFTIGCCILILVIYESILKKRQEKEEQILRTFAYQPWRILVTQSVLYFLPGVVVMCVVLPFLISWLNTLVRTFGYSDILSYNLLQFLISAVISIVIYLALRGGFYVARNKKST